ncbi:MAG: thermostable hemolysin [Hydrogenophaga sp.]
MSAVPRIDSSVSSPPVQPVSPAPRLHIVEPGSPQRVATEAFIQRVFAQRFEARVAQFAPVLVSLRDPLHGEILAAAGYRPADSAPLFLERYLGEPVEQRLSAMSGVPVQRSGVFEVGHLAAEQAGEGRRLIALLGQHLAAHGAQWVVSTLTESLRHLFLRLGITPLVLGAADPERLGADAQAWGRYYEHQPIVLAGQLPQALQRLARRSASAHRNGGSA